MIILSVLIIFLSSLAIYYSGKWFAVSSSKAGDYFRLSKSVKGATIDAVASSLPELMIAVFSVILFKEVGVGIGTVTGSTLFNLLVIPSIAVLVSPKVFKVSQEVVARDMMFYNISVFVLLAALLYSTTWSIFIPLIFIGIYIWYVKVVAQYTMKYRASE